MLHLLSLGLSNKEIAHRMVIAPDTVKNHLAHIRMVTGALGASRTELAIASLEMEQGRAQTAAALHDQLHGADDAMRFEWPASMPVNI